MPAREQAVEQGDERERQRSKIATTGERHVVDLMTNRIRWTHGVGWAAVCLAGMIALWGGWWWRQRLLTDRGVVATELPRAKLLELQDRARGSMRVVTYKDQDRARVAAKAVARHADGSWQELPEGKILTVTGMMHDDAKEPWVRGRLFPGGPESLVLVHPSFLERYTPLVLDQQVELSDVRLMTIRERGRTQVALTGFLRNTTSQTLSQGVVRCDFQDPHERSLAIDRQEGMVLPPLELVRFQTGPTDRPFASVSIQIMHATPEGLRNYLPTVVVQRSAMP